MLRVSRSPVRLVSSIQQGIERVIVMGYNTVFNHKYPTRNWEVGTTSTPYVSVHYASIQQGIERFPQRPQQQVWLCLQVSNKELREELISSLDEYLADKYPTRNWELTFSHVHSIRFPSIQQGIESKPSSYPSPRRGNASIQQGIESRDNRVSRARGRSTSIQQGIERAHHCSHNNRYHQVSNKELRASP